MRRLSIVVLWTLMITITVLAAFATVGIAIWVIRHPEAAVMIGFAVWVLRFGWKEAMLSQSKRRGIGVYQPL